MALFVVFLPIQVVVLLVTAYALQQSLRRTTRHIVHKNSHRMDGSYSAKRHEIEIQSLTRAGYKILRGLCFIFLVCTLTGLVVVGLCALGSDWELVTPDDKPIFNFAVDSAIVKFINEWQWQLLAAYVVLAFVVFPPYIRNLYQTVLNRFSAHANSRFIDYYRMESVAMMERSELSIRPESERSGRI